MQTSSTVLSLQNYHQAHNTQTSMANNNNQQLSTLANQPGQLSRSSSTSGGTSGLPVNSLQLAVLHGSSAALEVADAIVVEPSHQNSHHHHNHHHQQQHHHNLNNLHLPHLQNHHSPQYLSNVSVANGNNLQLELSGSRRPSAMLQDILSTRRPSTLLAAIRGPGGLQPERHHQYQMQQQQQQQQQALLGQRPRLLSSLHERTSSEKSLGPELPLIVHNSNHHHHHQQDSNHLHPHQHNSRSRLQRSRDSGNDVVSMAPSSGAGGDAQRPSGGRFGERAQRQRQQNRRIGDDALSSALSALYAKVIVILGVAMPITEVITQRIPAAVYHSFYIYLYVVSVLFVLFLHVTQMRTRAMISLIKTYQETQGEYPMKKRQEHFGSFYLRVGAISFGIGTMVHSGLELGQYFEMSKIPNCSTVISAIAPATRMALCIVQMQFIFLNTTELDMGKHKVIARFGLMHMVATNLCEWLYVLVEETKHEIHDMAHQMSDFVAETAAGDQYTPAMLTTTTTTTTESPSEQILAVLLNETSATTAAAIRSYFNGHSECTRTSLIMGNLVHNAAPFLFPCTIEYSLICAVILYEMWKKVKSLPDIEKQRRNSVKHASAALKRAHHFSVDCSRAHRGMFAGIIVVVVTIICLIMYFVLHVVPTYEGVAIAEVTICEIILYAVTTLAVGAAVIRMRDLRYQRQHQGHHSSSVRLDCTLLVVAQTGVYLYGMFSIIGSYYADPETGENSAVGSGGAEAMAAEILSLLQTSVQTLFILNACWRRCRGAEQNRTKPGREIVTFLLVANMSMWFINTLIKGHAGFRPSHLVLYGDWAWTVITHVSMPLAIFYRFHSTICLFEIWKSAYKMGKGGEH